MVWCGIPARTETILTLLFMFAIVMLVKDLVVVCLGVKTVRSLEIFLKSQNRIEEHNHVKSQITTFSLYIFIEINFLVENSITVSGYIWHV